MEPVSFFPSLVHSLRLVIVGNWNNIVDHNIDSRRGDSGRSGDRSLIRLVQGVSAIGKKCWERHKDSIRSFTRSAHEITLQR